MLSAAGEIGRPASLSRWNPGFEPRRNQKENSPPVFRAGVELIQVNAYVKDSQGNPVTGLAVDDFEVREDGRSQSITHFLPVNIPIDDPHASLGKALKVVSFFFAENAIKRESLAQFVHDKSARGVVCGSDGVVLSLPLH